MLPLDVFVLQHCSRLCVYWHGQVYSTAVCTAPGVYVLLQPVLLLDVCVLLLRPPGLPLSVSVLQHTLQPWTCLFYSSLCCPVCVHVHMLKNDLEHISESSLCFLFHGMEFRAFLSLSEWFGTEFREFSVPRNSRNSVGINHLFRLFRLPRSNYFVGNCQP